MADEELVRILREEGVEVWNRLRKYAVAEHDIHRADLSGADLSGVYLLRADLGRVNLGGANLGRAVLYGADLNNADLRGANLRGANLGRAELNSADLLEADLSAAVTCVPVPGKTNLSADFLTETNLSQACLCQANFRRANLSGADLRGADLRGADFSQAHLSGMNLRDANLSEARVGWTVFGDVDLRGVIGLESVEHKGPSTIGIHTIYRSKGQIPEVFLRGCGVPDEFITYMGSLVGRPIEYYSCFISYSSQDQEFADRLHADLQAKGVRCWFAPEDLKIGERIWERLDQSIRLHDKLLVILSANSIGSAWVEDEVMTAFEEERKRHKTMLFPVRLDDAVMASGEAWAGLVRQRHIGDFRAWKEHDAYRAGFEKLMRDLKAEG